MARALAWHARGHRFDPDILHPALSGRTIFDILDNKIQNPGHVGRLGRSCPSKTKQSKYNYRQTHRGDTARSASKKGRTADA